MGSVFSPHYARAHARAHAEGGQEPKQHLAINLALYGEKRAWVFTETKAQAGDISPQALKVAGNTWRSTQDGVELTFNDRSVPWGRPVVGRILLRGARASNHGARVLRAEGNHHWWPLMAVSRIEVQMQQPRLSWSGPAYHDLNFGDEPLAQGFRSWSWMRRTQGAATDIAYLPQGRGPQATPEVSLRVHADGSAEARPLPARRTPLEPSRWRLSGEGIWLPPGRPSVRLLEDTPFYRRCAWTTAGDDGRPVEVMHEALDMDRWRQPWVQALMRFRLRRV